MLQSLDTLIAFVVIMTIASLFVTLVVQMISGTLSLRGKNLANALAVTFQTIDPTLAASAHELAARILSDPLLSDSTLTNKNRGTAVPTIRKECWGLWDPRGGAYKLASAIRPEEVYDALKKLAAGEVTKSPNTLEMEIALDKAHARRITVPPPEDIAILDDAIATAKTNLDDARKADFNTFQSALAERQGKVRLAQAAYASAIGTPGSADAQTTLDNAQKALDAFHAVNIPGIARQLLSALGTSADKTQLITSKLTAVNAIAGVLPPALIAPFQNALATTAGDLVQIVDTERGKFKEWFGSAQDRAQQWFQMHTGGFTIGASIVVAFVFQLDAIDVFHYVSTNATARAALVASSEKILKEGNGILEHDSDVIQRINTDWKPATARLTAEELTGVTDVKILKAKLAAKVPSGTSFDPKAFEQAVKDTTALFFKEESGHADNLKAAIKDSGFELIPIAGWRWRVPTLAIAATVSPTGGAIPAVPAKTDHWESFLNILPHTFGIILFAGLLTLGAPYWYNLLKTLASLRPALAELIGADEMPKKEPKK